VERSGGGLAGARSCECPVVGFLVPPPDTIPIAAGFLALAVASSPVVARRADRWNPPTRFDSSSPYVE
jgi:hypothetical protein